MSKTISNTVLTRYASTARATMWSRLLASRNASAKWWLSILQDRYALFAKAIVT